MLGVLQNWSRPAGYVEMTKCHDSRRAAWLVFRPGEPSMSRQRVLILETDTALQSVLRSLFEREDLDVTVCASLGELQTGIMQYPQAVVVSDSWAQGDYDELSTEHRAEIVALGKTAEVILTTGRTWGLYSRPGELGTVRVIEKPYDLERLMALVRTGLERAGQRRNVSVVY